MDINVDQGVPRGDLVRFDSGKYMYRFPNGNLDIDRFTRDFDQYKEKRKSVMNEEINTFNSSQEPNTPPYKLPIGVIAINTKNAIIGLFNDFSNSNFGSNVFTKNYRLFYLGLALIIFGVLFFLLTLLIF
jgi:hypothetical protein